MKQQKVFSLKDRAKSFSYAINGLKALVKEEHNSRIHLLAVVVVVVLGFYLKVSASEWIALSIVISLVFITEILNTSLETLSDFVSPQKSERIKKTKDLAAAAVLVSAICALVVGLIVFVPKIGLL